MAATLSDGRVLVAGGEGATGPLSSTELYDPTTNTWSPGAPLPVALQDAAAAALPNDEALVVGGGARTDSVSGSTEIYDGATNAWSAGPPMPVALQSPAAAALGDGRVLVSGPSADYASTSEIYNPATDAWTFATSAGMVPEGGVAAASLGNGGAVFIGTSGGAQATAEMYDAANNTWTYLPWVAGWGEVPPAYEDGAAAELPGGAVLAVGGDLGTNSSIYDPGIHDWIPGPATSTVRSQPVAATLPNGDVLVAGGAVGDDGAQLASAMIFTPPASYTGIAGEYEAQPEIDGSAFVGEKLTVIGDDGSAFSYQWERCEGTDCSPIGPPTPASTAESVYTIGAADVGYSIQAVVTDVGAGDPLQNSSQTSWSTKAVAAATMGFQDGGWPEGPGIQLQLNRTDVAPLGSVDYTVTWPVVGREALVVPITGTATFLPGQWSADIVVPTLTHGVNVLPRQFTITLSNPVGATLTGPAQLTIPICTTDEACDISATRNPLDPLALSHEPGSDPLRGAGLFVDHQSAAARAAASQSNPTDARLIDRIAREPGVARFGSWNGAYPGRAVESYLDRAAVQEPGSVPMIATYRIVDGQCHRGDDTPADAAAYHTWITNFAEGIGDRPAILFLEMDSLITTPCLSPAGLAIRLGELRDALAVLSNCPHLVVYLDAGAADALSAKRAAHLLEQADVADAQGFFLNSTHFDWTRKEIKYGEKISKLLHGKHFVINTAENGQGPLKPRHPASEGNEVLCNPPDRGLGPLPSTKTGYKDLDAFAWIANPGVSGGPCRPGAPKTGVFWPALAISLAQHANYKVR